jgi:hypothetical protein
MVLPLLLAAIALDGHPAVAGPDAAWRYVLPQAGDPFEHPPLRAIPLGRERPDDVREMVRYRGLRRRYAQLRYGSPSSVRVTVVLDEVGPGDADLYVDADRNRRIEARDRVERNGRVWRLPLDVAVVEGESTRYLPRAAVFRLGATGLTFSFAAAGFLEGKVKVGDREHQARRMDGDGNGLLTDAQDRLWIDLNDDGRFDPAAEQFLYAPILALAEGRFAVRSDEFGGRLTLAPLEGTGSVRLALRRPEVAARVLDVAATLIGRDGSAVGLHGLDAEATVPVGEYRLGTVTVALADPGGGPKWNFVFSDNGGRPEHAWHKVVKGGATRIDPIGPLEMAVEIEEGAKSCRAGEPLRVQPLLYTGDGLLITTCFRGDQSANVSYGGPAAQVTLGEGDGPREDSASSGFA